jgi:hypothetical protein
MDDVFFMAITKTYKNRVFSFFSHWGVQACRQAGRQAAALSRTHTHLFIIYSSAMNISTV